MSDSIPEATEISSADISTNIGTITIDTLPQQEVNNNFLQHALPTICVNGYIELSQKKYINIVQKSILFAASNNIICSFGFIYYTIYAIFLIMFYMYLISIFCDKYKNTINYKKYKKFCIVLLVTSYIIKNTWVFIKIFENYSDNTIIVLGTFSFFQDMQLMYLTNESLFSHYFIM